MQRVLTGTDGAYRVTSGRCELYAVKTENGVPTGRMYPFAELKKETVFPGLAPVRANGAKYACVAKCFQDAAFDIAKDATDFAVTQAQFADFVASLPALLDGEAAEFARDQSYTDHLIETSLGKLRDVNQRMSKWEYKEFDDDNNLIGACSALGRYMGVEIQIPAGYVSKDSRSMMEGIFRASRIRHRAISLGGKWWKRSSGPMLGALRDGTPVALIPRGLSGYVLYNPDTDQTTKINAQSAQDVASEAFAVYRTLPGEKIGFVQLVRFVLGNHIYLDISIIFLFTFLASLVQVLPPIISGQIFNVFVPQGLRGMLTEAILILLAFQIANMGFSVVINLGFSRIKTMINLSLEAAVWDRLIHQNIRFFHKFTIGELLEKVRSLSRINNVLSMDLLKTAFSTLFSFVNIIVMWRYSPAITKNVLWLFAGCFAVTFLIDREKYRLSAKFLQLSNKASSLNHQLIDGIQRIKTSFAEDRAYALWSTYEAECRYLSSRISAFSAALNAFYTFFSLASVAFVFLMISTVDPLEMGAYVAFSATFLIFQSSMMNFLRIANAVAELLPECKNVAPILEVAPDHSAQKIMPKDIDGSLEFNHVSFNYDQYGKGILHDVSFRIERGESIGIVGASGSGKTTLLKLILGLYTPTSGKVYFGGYDLSAVDLTDLRHRIGVATQNGELAIGSIFSNIAGADAEITVDDAKAALETVDLLSEIERLPHGIYSMLDADASHLSAGQKQRLLIARAIAKERKYYLFDEATSRLDNLSQRRVMDAIYALNGTKIIIAQRLSTVARCDRIIMLDKGVILADGAYDDIINKNPSFAGASE